VGVSNGEAILWLKGGDIDEDSSGGQQPFLESYIVEISYESAGPHP